MKLFYTVNVTVLAGLSILNSQAAATPDFSVTLNLGSGNPPPQRLQVTPGVFAPLNTDIWFVADKNGDGLNLPGTPGTGVVTEDFFNTWFSGTSENVVFRTDFVDGALFNNLAGSYSRNGNVDSSADGLNIAFNDTRLGSEQAGQTTRVFGILWDNATADNAAGVDVGDRFNVFEFTITPVGALNTWSYTGGTVVASQGWTIVAVPEPSTYALLALGGLGAFACRRFRRA